jgi:hypothetical protein
MAAPALILALEGLTKTLNGIKDQFNKAMDFADKAQKVSLGLGKTYDQTRKELGSTMQGLRGDITQKFGAAIAGMEAGLQGNTAGIAKLINQQQLTGTTSAATAKAFARLETSLGTSRDQTNVLAENLIKTGNIWNVTTDELVASIDALAATFPAQDLAGMGVEITGAMTELTAELGPAVGNQLNSVMKTIMDTSLEGYSNLVRLGIGDIRERLSAAKNQEEALKILKSGIITAAESVKTVAGGADKFFGQIGVAQNIFGAATLDFTTVAKNFGKRTKEEQDKAKDFGMTLENLKNEILTPFQEFFANKFYPIFIEVADGLSAMAQKVVAAFSGWLDKVIPDGKDAFKKLSLVIIDFVIIALNRLGKGWDYVTEKIIPSISTAMFNLQNAIHFGIVVPMETVKIAFNLFESGVLTVVGVLGGLIGVIVKAIAAVGDLFGFDVQGMSIVADAMLDITGQAFDKIAENSDDMLKSIDKIFTPPEESAANFKQAWEDAANDPDGLGNKILNNIREDIRSGNGIRREQNDSLKAARERLGSIDDKTIDQKRSSSSFLGDSTASIEYTLERILGVRGSDTASDLQVKLLEKQTELMQKQLEAQGASADQLAIANRIAINRPPQAVKNMAGGL